MFTGIVTELGRIAAVEPVAAGRRLVIEAKQTRDGLEIGDSVAVNGACLTATRLRPDGFAVEAVQETLDRTNLGSLERGDPVDLERPVPVTGRLDGHIVQGHVDGAGTVEWVKPEGDARRMRVALPEGLTRYVVEKGSITVDGVSLTVTAADAAGFEVALIPHTLEVTVLGRRDPGDRVNVEVDVLAKYIERLLEARA